MAVPCCIRSAKPHTPCWRPPSIVTFSQKASMVLPGVDPKTPDHPELTQRLPPGTTVLGPSSRLRPLLAEATRRPFRSGPNAPPRLEEDVGSDSVMTGSPLQRMEMDHERALAVSDSGLPDR